MWALHSLISLCWEAQKKNSLVGNCIEKKEINKLNTVSTKQSWSTWRWRVNEGMGRGIDCFRFFLLRSFCLFFSFQDSQFTPAFECTITYKSEIRLLLWPWPLFYQLPSVVLPSPTCRKVLICATYDIRQNRPKSVLKSTEILWQMTLFKLINFHLWEGFQFFLPWSDTSTWISPAHSSVWEKDVVRFFTMFWENSSTRCPSEKPGVGGHWILAPRRI